MEVFLIVNLQVIKPWSQIRVVMVFLVTFFLLTSYSNNATKMNNLKKVPTD